MEGLLGVMQLFAVPVFPATRFVASAMVGAVCEAAEVGFLC